MQGLIERQITTTRVQIPMGNGCDVEESVAGHRAGCVIHVFRASVRVRGATKAVRETEPWDMNMVEQSVPRRDGRRLTAVRPFRNR